MPHCLSVLATEIHVDLWPHLSLRTWSTAWSSILQQSKMDRRQRPSVQVFGRKVAFFRNLCCRIRLLIFWFLRKLLLLLRIVNKEMALSRWTVNHSIWSSRLHYGTRWAVTVFWMSVCVHVWTSWFNLACNMVHVIGRSSFLVHALYCV